MQTFTVEAGTGAAAIGTVWTRVFPVGGPWGAWRSVAVAETGSNANGAYTRFADGTQVAWASLVDTASAWSTASGGLYTRSTALVWTYPAAFASAPVVIPGAVRNAVAAMGCGNGSPGLTTVDLVPWSAASLAGATTKSVTAIAAGRWL